MDNMELLRSVHHALRAPLGSILNVTEMLLLGMDGALSTDVQKSVACIAEDAGRLQRVTEALLAYVHLVERSPRWAQTKVALVAQDAIKAATAQTGKTVALDIAKRLPFLVTDEEMLHELLLCALRYAAQVDGGAPLIMHINLRADGWAVGIGHPLSDKERLPMLPDLLIKDELGILLMTCRQVTTLLGGQFHIACSRDRHVRLAMLFSPPGKC